MKRVAIFSILLIGGLIGSQVLPELLGELFPGTAMVIRLLTMLCLSFIMIHVGMEFEIDRTRLRSYAVDYGVAATAAAFPWIFCSVYFIALLSGPGAWSSFDAWRDALLAGRFAAPTSAGVLFSMLAAAGLAGTWLFRKARVLAIFDDLDTVLLMIPLKMMIVGLRWQLAAMVLIMFSLLWLGWKYLHRVQLPGGWKWVLGYSAAITAVSEIIYETSKLVDDVVPVHIEVLLPAFILGCMMAHPAGHGSSEHEKEDQQDPALHSAAEEQASFVISAVFMALVGLSMPAISLADTGGLAPLLWHTLLITVLSNLGKMFPLFCYRSEATWRQRLALCVGMWPRGEVGAGILVLSLSYGIGGAMVAVAGLSLALNLVCTGLFILIVKRLLGENTPGTLQAASALRA